MYILTCLRKRGETTDTILYFISDNKGDLEEIILSIYEEALEATTSKEIIKEFISTFHILKVPYIGRS